MLHIDENFKGDELAEASDLLVWNKRLLATIGIWPKESSDLRWTLNFVYIFIHVSMEYADFIEHIGNFEEILANISETATFTMLLFKFVVFRKNYILSQLIDAMNEDCENDKYQSLREKKIYGRYNLIVKTYCKAILFLASLTAILYYLRPFAGYLFAKSSNGSTLFVLPYKSRIFYEITEVHTYALTYIYQGFILPIVSLGVVGTDGLLMSLTLHVCGELAVLADRIRSLKKQEGSAHYLGIRTIVKKHLRLTWMAVEIDKVFSGIFLGQLSGSAVIICLNAINVMKNSETTQGTSLISFVLYELSILSFLYSYCFIGECLIQESHRVHAAFSQCAWYEMLPHQSKDLIICMAGTRKPLHLTAGKLYIFSLEIFAEVIKTSMAYISVLRTLM